MKSRLLFIFILMSCTSLWAQDTIVTIKTGSRIKDVLTASDIFLYPQYISGTAFFRDGTKAMAKMNYNKLYDQILFINPKGDTLALTDEKTIKLIALANDTFYYNEGYVKSITSNGIMKLALKQVWEVADTRKMGTYNSPTTAFAVTSYLMVTDGVGKSHDLILNEDLLLRKKTTYYFGNDFNNFVPAGKKNLLLLFPKKQKIISKYLKENKVNFNDRDDLEKLSQFLAENH